MRNCLKIKSKLKCYVVGHNIEMVPVNVAVFYVW